MPAFFAGIQQDYLYYRRKNFPTGMFQEVELISFYGDDEVKLLIGFPPFLQQEHKKKNLTLWA